MLKNLQVFHYTSWWGLGERRYSSYSFPTSALNGGEWSASRHFRALALGKGPPVPIVQEAGWAPEPVWTQRLEKKSFRLCRGSNFDRAVVQPVARRYTDWATRFIPQCLGILIIQFYSFFILMCWLNSYKSQLQSQHKCRTHRDNICHN
jgi:hypothetical protein